MSVSALSSFCRFHFFLCFFLLVVSSVLQEFPSALHSMCDVFFFLLAEMPARRVVGTVGSGRLRPLWFVRTSALGKVPLLPCLIAESPLPTLFEWRAMCWRLFGVTKTVLRPALSQAVFFSVFPFWRPAR